MLVAVAAALVLVSAASGASAPTATVTVTATGLNDALAGGFEPPDVQVAVGPGFLVQMVNLAQRIWSTGAVPQVVKTVSLASFFDAGGDQLTDPRVVYDAPSGRWLASVSDEPRQAVLLAVSRTSDPTAVWTVRSFAAAGCADQPRLGVADGIVVLAADIFEDCDKAGPAPVLGGEMWVINKQQLLSTTGLVASTTYGPNDRYASLAPVQSLSATSTEYVVSVDNPTSRVVHLLAVDGIPPAAVSIRETATLPVSPLQQPPPARQPSAGGSTVTPALATNDDRVLDSVWENGRLWLSANSACTPVGDSFLRSCARVIELSTIGTPAVDWDSDLGFPGASIFYPAIRPDSAGNLVIVFGESSSTILPEVLVVGRTPDGTFTAPALVGQGVAPHLGLRYGDYFGAARDPGNPKLVWVSGEAGSAVQGSHGWTTVVGSVAITAAGATPPAVTGKAPPGVLAVTVQAQQGTPVRLAYRALDDGAKVKAIVTVSRGGTVYYTATTATGTLHANQVYYVLWRPGAKLRGAFTFCIRSVGPTGTKSPQSCAAVTLR